MVSSLLWTSTRIGESPKSTSCRRPFVPRMIAWGKTLLLDSARRWRRSPSGCAPEHSKGEGRRGRRRRRRFGYRFFADVFFLDGSASDTPVVVALCRVAASVRLRAFAILASGSLRAKLLRRRRSSFDHALRTDGFFFPTIALTTFAPDCFANKCAIGVMHGLRFLATMARTSSTARKSG